MLQGTRLPFAVPTRGRNVPRMCLELATPMNQIQPKYIRYLVRREVYYVGLRGDRTTTSRLNYVIILGIEEQVRIRQMQHHLAKRCV